MVLFSPRSVITALLWLITAIPIAYGQQTIFNVPSADVTEQGQIFYQHQSSFRPVSPNRNWIFSNNLGLGLGHHTELDLSNFNFDLDNRQNGTTLGFGSKTVLPLFAPSNHESPWKLTFGGLATVSTASTRVGDWLYSHLSYEIPKTHTRFTAGAFQGNQPLFDRHAIGGIFGLEAPLGQHWMIQTDWFSGNNAQAYVIPGIVYRTNRLGMLSLGIQIPTARETKKHTGFVFEYTVYLGKKHTRRCGAGNRHASSTTDAMRDHITDLGATANGEAAGG